MLPAGACCQNLTDGLTVSIELAGDSIGRVELIASGTRAVVAAVCVGTELRTAG